MKNKAIIQDKIIKDFSSKKILVIGDVMVDEYITGSVKRISPEAPVPVLDFRQKTLEAGGASNVAHNLRGLGADVRISGVASEDEAGKWLRTHFNDLGIDASALYSEEGRPTTLKSRFATKGQQLLRVDREDASVISESVAEKIFENLEKQINEIDAVVLSDYRKGVLSDTNLVKRIIRLCNEKNVFISIDSKSSNIEAFSGIDFVKPNNLELEAAVGIQIIDDESFDKAGREYLRRSGAKNLIVTRGSKGIAVFVPGKEREDYPARDVQVYDVCGAGDTVISTITLAKISGLEMDEAAMLANLAAGVVISKVGTVAISAAELKDSVV